MTPSHLMTPAVNSTWTAARLERALALRAQNYTDSEIAADLGGISRTAVNGKLTREHIPPRISDDLWPESRVCRLKELQAQRLSATAIGIELGVSRNAVMGKLHRLKLPSQCPRPYPTRGPTMRPVKPRPAPQAPPGAYPGALGITMMALTSTTCHWPDDAKPPLYCGRPVCRKHTDEKKLSSYCWHHDALSRRADRA